MVKKGQLNLSFGMIFSIILIIVFLTFTFYVITKLVGGGENAQLAKFTNDLQNNIDRAWVGSQASDTNEYKIPKKVELVCLIDFSEDSDGSPSNKDLYEELELEYFEEGNLVIYPVDAGGSFGSNVLEHINLTEIVDGENPYCIESNKGEISITIKKDYGETLVKITR